MAAILNFDGHFRSYNNYDKLQIWNISDDLKHLIYTVDISFDYCKKLFYADDVLNQIAVLLVLVAIFILKRTPRWKHTWHY